MRTNRFPLLLGLLALLILMGAGNCPARAAETTHAPNPLSAEEIKVPEDTSWAREVVVGIMWIFITAILLGPIVMFFRVEPPPEPAAHDAHDAGGHAASTH